MLAMSEEAQLWNNDWLIPELRHPLPLNMICDQEKLKHLSPIITFKERLRYDEFYTNQNGQ